MLETQADPFSDANLISVGSRRLSPAPFRFRRRGLACARRVGQSREMVKITGTYSGQLHCEAVHGPSGMQLETDAPKDNQGRGEAFSPTDLCATALATCVVTTMAIQAQTSGFAFEGVTFSVEKHMSAEPPRRIAKLDVHVYFNTTFDSSQRKRLARAAMTCPVHRSLGAEVAMPVTFHWADGSVETLDGHG